MLDWLSNDQRASYAESSQFLDAPDTPAPLFAYRALKSVLFGSHDDEEGYENEKENFPLETRLPYLETKSISSAPQIKSSTPKRPTPRRMLSPAKSILRTPGIPSPRRQNVSVKFKDIKQTLTNLTPIAEGSVTEVKAIPQLPEPPTHKASKSEARPAQTEFELAAELQISECDSQPETYYNVKEIDAYVAATEREMKKLVRYGQRMREYARLSQKENATLKRELDNARKENAMLRQREDLTVSQKDPDHAVENNELFDLSLSSKHGTEVATTRIPANEQKTVQEPHAHPLFRHQPPIRAGEKRPKKNSSANTVKSRDGEVLGTSQEDTVTAEPHVSISGNEPAQRERVASRTQLAPDRLEAAKARLKVKSEERRKILGMIEQARREDHCSSALDWQNL